MGLRRLVQLASATVLLVVLVVVGTPPAQAKAFRIERVVIDAALLPDASLHVRERITYVFDGEFHNGARPIPPGDYQITDVVVREGEHVIPSRGAPYDLAWSFDARDETRTFAISYVVRGAAKVGSDVGELYWQWVGADHPGVGLVDVRLLLDPPADGLRVWAHGPLDGYVEPTPAGARWRVKELDAGSFVEGRVAVPASWFAVPSDARPRLPTILAEERALADEANAERRRIERMERLSELAGYATPLVIVLGWLALFVIWRRWGTEHDTSHVGDYVHEPPDDPPAVVGALLEWNDVDGRDFGSTVVDLAQRRYLSITQEDDDWRLTRLSPDGDEGDEGDLRPWEQDVLDRLFADGAEVTQSELVAWGKDERVEAAAFWKRFEEGVAEELKRRGYHVRNSPAAHLLNLLAIAIVAGVGVMAIAGEHLVGIAAVFSAVGQLIVGVFALRRRSLEGATRAAEWKAFARKLRDFSQMEDAPIGHLVLWERYLVYAVALGLPTEVVRGLAMRVPAEVGGVAAHQSWYYAGHDGGYSGFDSIGSFATDFGSDVQNAFVPQSSSSGSGGGGGFSGGGGGGGGGGGIGAS